MPQVRIFDWNETNRSAVSDNLAAVARCVQGKGLIRVNGKPLKLFAPEVLRAKLFEPVLLVGADKFAEVDIRVRVTGGGHVSQVYAVRQAVRFPAAIYARQKDTVLTRGFQQIAKAIVSTRTRCIDLRLAPRRRQNTDWLNSRSPTTPSTSMSTPRTSSRRSSSSSTAACLSPTPGVASPRSLVDRVPVRGSRSPIVDRFFGHVGKRGLARTRTAFGIALISYESRLASNNGLLRCIFMAPWEIGIRLESTWPPYDTPWRVHTWLM